jgi:hypothetical protein
LRVVPVIVETAFTIENRERAREMFYISGMKDKTRLRSKSFVLHKPYDGQKAPQEQEICLS